MKAIETLKKIVGCEVNAEGAERAFTDSIYDAHLRIWFKDFYEPIKALSRDVRNYFIGAYFQRNKIAVKKESDTILALIIHGYGRVVRDKEQPPEKRFLAVKGAGADNMAYFGGLEDALEHVLG